MTRRIEVQGTWLENAGARQMLAAAVRGLRQEDPSLRIAIDPRWGSHSLHAGLGLECIVPRAMPGARALDVALGVTTRVAPRVVRRMFDGYGLAQRRDSDGLVDASGFALSDQWGARKAEQRWAAVRGYAEAGKPVVLLPQAMGPFTDRATSEPARRILDVADRVWVRDRASLGYACDLTRNQVDIRRAPDITILEPGIPPLAHAADVVIVPNIRLVEQGAWDRHDYVDALLGSGRAALERGRSVAVMVHTLERGDRQLADALVTALGCSLVVETDAARAKGVIGDTELVVGSRYHALLGALAQGVPAVAIGWSHKYDELFEDFGVPELATAERSFPGEHLVRDALDDGVAFRGRIASRLEALRADVESMWSDCQDALGIGGRLGAEVR